MTNGDRGGAVAWPSGSPDSVLLDVYYYDHFKIEKACWGITAESKNQNLVNL